MKVAVIHDWFNEIGGAEKVVREILLCYPEADVFCLLDHYSPENREKYLLNKKTKTSFIQHIPFSRRFYRFLFPLFPMAIEHLNVSDYDLIISSSSAVAKGVKKHANQVHVCYCHSPMRYAWDLKEEYLSVPKNKLARKVLSYFLDRIKNWDLQTVNRVDCFIANSENVKMRIKNNYGREAKVIYPPVSISNFKPISKKENYYFAASRLVSYKKTEQIIKAFADLPHLKLVVAGTGPILEKLKKMAGPNVNMLGFISSSELAERIGKAKAFIVNANEDFGITVVEAQACATPILAPYLGGYKETVTEKTGIFFQTQCSEDIVKVVQEFESGAVQFNEHDFMLNIKKFDRSCFQEEFKKFTLDCYQKYGKA